MMESFMTNDEFKCWINGYLELSTEEWINTKQLIIIKNHINLVKAVDGVLDLDIGNFLATIEENIRAKTLIKFSDLKEIWFNGSFVQ